MARKSLAGAMLRRDYDELQGPLILISEAEHERTLDPLYSMTGLHIIAPIECGGTGICPCMQHLYSESTPVS